MMCLSVQQPFAEAIVADGKDIENRTWPTRFRGPCLIHAGKRPYDGYDMDDVRGLPLGAIVGLVEIVGCVTQSDSPWFFGPYGFVLTNLRKFVMPIPYRGRQMFFDVPDEVVAAAIAALGED